MHDMYSVMPRQLVFPAYGVPGVSNLPKTKDFLHGKSDTVLFERPPRESRATVALMQRASLSSCVAGPRAASRQSLFGRFLVGHRAKQVLAAELADIN